MSQSLAGRLLVAIYLATTLLSACLLFALQPIIGKFILPWFGGSPAVWSTCLVFFETVLVAGYAYAHASERYLPTRARAAVHLTLLAIALWMLPIAPDLHWKTATDSQPTWRILCLLASSVGVPYFVLSSTGPLVQAWFARSFPDRSPYRLYALSNVGSLAALVLYPFFLEPRFGVAEQAELWTSGFLGFAILSALAAAGTRAWRSICPAPKAPAIDAQPDAAPTLTQNLAWLGLAGLASMMLLATTNHVCQDIAVMPFLWVAPLGLYLVSFIITFDHPGWHWRRSYAWATLALLGANMLVDQLITGGAGVTIGFGQELVLQLGGLFALSMVCHGELVRLRPTPRYLTSFYLMISVGGALGGGFVALVAPQIFSTFFEWRLGLVAGALLAGWVIVDGQPQSFLQRRFALIAPALLLVFAGLSCRPQMQAAGEPGLLATARNFYGVISVLERNAANAAERTLNYYSGRIVHGTQFVDPAKQDEPTTYYGRTTGVAAAFAALGDRPAARVGVIGLGVGTVAAYAAPGQTFRFYEINPDGVRFAEQYFSFLKRCRGQAEIVLGDARLSLEQEEPQHFDLLVLDAFSGDAIPTHLLTAEAFSIYQRHLQPDAIVAVHISNRYLDLAPVIAGLAEHCGYQPRRFTTAANPATGQFAADWILLQRPTATQTAESSLPAGQPLEVRQPILWTDDHTNLFELLK